MKEEKIPIYWKDDLIYNLIKRGTGTEGRTMKKKIAMTGVALVLLMALMGSAAYFAADVRGAGRAEASVDKADRKEEREARKTAEDKAGKEKTGTEEKAQAEKEEAEATQDQSAEDKADSKDPGTSESQPESATQSGGSTGSSGSAPSGTSGSQSASVAQSGGSTGSSGNAGSNSGGGQAPAPQPKPEAPAQPSAPAPKPEPEAPAHVHSYSIPVYGTEQRWVDTSWDETVSEPVYGYIDKAICNTCGADITGDIGGHGYNHMINGENGSYKVISEQVQTGTNTYTVHHDDGHYESVQVVTGYQCSCGAAQ